jgi:NAD(P)-dependent dehydrogenase (short-subunit alcohol dehydrogenase family)
MDGKKSVLITGSSTGIGRASALRLDKEGFQVFAGVRKSSDGDALKSASSGRLIPVILDVTESESIAKAVKTVSEKTNGELYGLMNNAGVSAGFTVELTPISALRNVLEVNVISVFAVTQAFLPLLRKSRGRVINTGSAFGLTALPGKSVYAASKYAVEAISESLRVELSPFGISVSVIEPGAIATEIWKKGVAQNEELILNANPDIYKLYAPLMMFYKNNNENQKYLPPEAVADRAYHAFTAKKPKYHYVVGSDAKFLAFLERLPERIRDWIVYKIIYKEVELL